MNLKKKLQSNTKKVSVVQRMKKFFAARPKNEKPKRPRSYAVRKMGAITFWVLFSFMFLVVLITVTSNSNSAQSTNEEQPEVKINPATKPEAIQFAEEFTRTYFTWEPSNEGWEDRQERLSNYLAKGLDEHAGLVVDGLEWAANTHEIRLGKVDEITENKAHIIFEVSTEMKKGKESKVVKKDFAVPVVYNGSTYGVYELPYITQLKEETNVEVSQDQYQTTLTSVKDSEKVQGIQSFLDTFFSSYVEDSEEQLSYILTDKDHQNGLNGSLKFNEVESAEIYEGNTANRFIVITSVTFDEPETKIEFQSVYKMVVEQRDDHYVVSKLNAEDIVEDMVEQ